MTFTFKTLADTLSTLARIDRHAVDSLIRWPESAGLIGDADKLPADAFAHLYSGANVPENIRVRATACLVEVLAFALAEAGQLARIEGDRTAWLLERAPLAERSPFAFCRALCGWSFDQLANVLGVSTWAARRLCRPDWHAVTGGDLDKPLARLGQALAEWLAAHERRRGAA